MQNTVRWHSDWLDGAVVGCFLEPLSNKSDANVDESDCTVWMLLLFSKESEAILVHCWVVFLASSSVLNYGNFPARRTNKFESSPLCIGLTSGHLMYVYWWFTMSLIKVKGRRTILPRNNHFIWKAWLGRSSTSGSQHKELSPQNL